MRKLRKEEIFKCKYHYLVGDGTDKCLLKKDLPTFFSDCDQDCNHNKEWRGYESIKK